MKIVDVSVSRPVFITMIILAMVVVGIISFGRLGVDLFPNVEFPYVMISTTYPGASPEEMESLVVKPIEDGVSAINGVKNIYSTANEGFAMVVLEFTLDTKPETAAQDVRDKMSAIRGQLPQDAEEPVIRKMDPNAQAILIYSVSGDRNIAEVRELTDNTIKQRLQQVPGVGDITISGGLEREIQVRVSAEKLKSYGLSILQISNALKSENLNVPGGRQTLADKEILLRTKGEFESVEEINQIVVGSQGDSPIYLGDVAKVVDTYKEQRQYSRVNRENGVMFSIKKQSGTNTVEVGDAVVKELEILQKELPPDIKVEQLMDSTKFIKDSNRDVTNSLVEGALLAILVIFLFLRNWRSTIISGIALPVSVITTFALMYVMDFTINMLSMMGLSLSIGILIDDAIVVIENIYRKIEEGMAPAQAVKEGTAEIGLAVLATTLTIVAVFMPVAFMDGIVGQFFRQFGYTVTFAVLISLFVAFTITPMLSARFLRKPAEEEGQKGRIQRFFDKWETFYASIDRNYGKTLAWALKHRLLVIMFAFFALVGSFVLAGAYIHTGFQTESDNGEFSIDIETPSGTSLAVTDARVRGIENYLLDKKHFPEVKTVYCTVGSTDGAVNRGGIYVKLVDRKERKRGVAEVRDALRPYLVKLPGVTATVTNADMVQGGKEMPVELYIQGDNIQVLKRISEQVMNEMHKVKGLVSIDSNYGTGRPETVFRIQRDKAGDLGLSLTNIAMTLRSAVNGEVPSKYKENDDEYDIRVQLDENDRKDLDQALNLTVPNQSGELIPVREVVTAKEEKGPAETSRRNRQRDIKVGADVQGITIGDATKEVQKIMANIKMPPGYKWVMTGESERMGETFTNMLLALLLGVIFIYMILAAQFESFIHPFTIMFSLPLAVVGALLALIVTAKQLDMMSFIGIIMLMGLVTKNAILLIDYTLTLRKRGLSRLDALLKAGPTRLRPILMTTMAMICGMLPSALGTSEGSEFRSGMAVAVIGGLITSTLLTLVVIPVVYTILDDISRVFKRKEKKVPVEEIKPVVG